MHKISVIIPVYKSEKFLEKCFDSIIGQTLDDVEIIVVNDGSPDNSQKIIDRYKEKHPDVFKTFIQENKGQAAARNLGLQYAEGEYISFVDSDDYIETNTYKTAYNYARDNMLDIVCFGMYEVKGDERKPVDYRFVRNQEPKISYVLNESAPWNKIIKRELLVNNNVKFTENRIYEDLELMPQLVFYTDKIGYLDECLYNYVIHQGSTMRQDKYNPKLACIFDVADTLKEKFYNTEYRTELEFLFIEHLLHGAVLRFLKYEEGKKDIERISDIMKETFPKWRKNKYYKMQHWKYKVMCNLAYNKSIPLLKRIFG